MSHHSLLKIILLLLGFNKLTIEATAQKKITWDVSFGTQLPVGSTKIVDRTFENPPLTVNYLSKLKNDNPNINLLVGGNLPINNSLQIGLASGIQFFFDERRFNSTKTMFPAIPALITSRYKIPIGLKYPAGIELKAGYLFYSRDQFIQEIKNNSLLELGIFQQISKKFFLGLAARRQYEFFQLNFQDAPGNFKELFKSKTSMSFLSFSGRFEF